MMGKMEEKWNEKEDVWREALFFSNDETNGIRAKEAVAKALHGQRFPMPH